MALVTEAKQETLEGRVRRLETAGNDHMERILWLERQRQWLLELVALAYEELGRSLPKNTDEHPHERADVPMPADYAGSSGNVKYTP
jgi:hypothetical protein